MGGPYNVHYITYPKDLEQPDDRTLMPGMYCEWLVLLTCLRLAESSGNAALADHYRLQSKEAQSRVKRDCLRRDRIRKGTFTAMGSSDNWPGTRSGGSGTDLWNL